MKAEKHQPTMAARAPDASTGSIDLHRCDCTELLRGMPDGSVDIVLTDPPYMYLDHRLDRPFDLAEVYGELARVLRPDRGAMAVFGRGPSFYRTGALLESIGLRFLEEVVWLKSRRSSPVTALGRVHETVFIWGLGRAGINRVRVPLPEKHAMRPERLCAALEGMGQYLRNPRDLAAMRAFVETGIHADEGAHAEGITIRGGRKRNRAVYVLRSMAEGGREESIIAVARGREGLHPAQKPVPLLKRLLALVAPPDREPSETTVLDPFGGSFSTMAAAREMGMQGVSCEIDPVYFERGAQRMQSPAGAAKTL